MTNAQRLKRQAKIARRKEARPVAYETHQLRTSGMNGIRLVNHAARPFVARLPLPANEPPERRPIWTGSPAYAAMKRLELLGAVAGVAP